MVQRTFMLRLFMLACLVTVLAALVPVMPTFPGRFGDKVQHAIAFFTLTALAVPAFPKLGASVVFLSMAAFGGLIELMQLLPILQRDADLVDWIVDCAAVACAIPVARLVVGLIPHHQGPAAR